MIVMTCMGEGVVQKMLDADHEPTDERAEAFFVVGRLIADWGLGNWFQAELRLVEVIHVH